MGLIAISLHAGRHSLLVLALEQCNYSKFSKNVWLDNIKSK